MMGSNLKVAYYIIFGFHDIFVGVTDFSHEQYLCTIIV